MARTTGPSIDRPTLEYFAFRGPHRVASGSLEPGGLPGLVYAPVGGRDLPLVALAHGWLQPVRRYTALMSFLASWGIVSVAPDTRRGPVPSHSGFARDLQTALGIAVTGRLGGGRVRVDPARAGVLGHSLGGGVAVLAAAQDPAIAAVVTVAAAETSPSAVAAAARVRAPGLHLVGAKDDLAGSGDDSVGATIARAWGGPSTLRTLKGGGHSDIALGSHWTTTLAGISANKKVHEVVQRVSAAFFLRHLAEQPQLADDLDGEIAGTVLLESDPLDAGRLDAGNR